MIFENDKYKVSIDFDIKTYEIDIAQHVNNMVYIKWIEDLRSKLFEKIIPIDDLLQMNLYPVVVSTNIFYKQQIKLGDKLKGIMYIDSIKHNLINLKIHFLNKEKICACAEQRCVLLNLINGKIDKEKLKFLIQDE